MYMTQCIVALAHCLLASTFCMMQVPSFWIAHFSLVYPQRRNRVP